MKTTIEISDHLMQRAKRLTRRQNCTFRSLAEEGLSRILDEREGQVRRAIKPVVFKGKGLAPEFQPGDWAKIREAAYEGRGG
jgi:hypothetical protein